MDNMLKNKILTPFNILYRIAPVLELKLMFRLKCGYKLDLENPKTYNEKLQWIKLYDRNPLMTKCCDKYAVRDYVKGKGCEEILNDLLWEGFNPEEIPFDELPNEFVIKATHGSTFNIICEDKSKLNRRKTISKCKRWLKEKIIPCYGEWFYGVEKPRIIVEKLLHSDDGEPLKDYKFFCFNGIPRLMYIDTWKNGSHTINAYDMKFNLYHDVELGHPNDMESQVKCPDAWEKMKDIAAKLSKDFTHVRVDLYYTYGKITFGELTFTKSAGFGKIKPIEFDYKMGDYLILPVK